MNRDNHVASKGAKCAVLLAFALFYVVSYLSGIANAADSGKAGKYPSRPIRIIVAAGPGGSLGNEIRALAPFLEKNLGGPVIIDYVVGADGMIAYNKIYREKPDGYTIAYFNLSSAIILQLTRETAKYDVQKYTPIGGWNAKYYVLVVHPDNWKTFADFLGDAKKRNLSVAGTGGHTILTAKALELVLGVKFNLVPYASSGEGIAATAGKHVDFLLTFITTPRPMIQAGKLRALAVLSPKPDPTLPGAPNIKELGHWEKGFIPAYGMFAAPPNTPKEVVAVLEKALGKAAANPEFLKIADKIGTYVDLISSSQLRKESLDQHNLVEKYKQFLKN